MVNFGRSNFLRKGLSRFENRVEKQIWSVELGEPGSMTKRALWPRLERCDASVIAWGEAQRFGVRSLTTIDFPEWLSSLLRFAIWNDSAQCFFHLETHERHTSDRKWLRSEHHPAPLFQHGQTEETSLCLQPFDSHALGIAFNGLNKSCAMPLPRRSTSAIQH